MKIIKQGEKDWPHTVQNHCRECGTVYVLEQDDEFGRDDKTSYGDHIASKCPLCQSTVRTSNPNIPRVTLSTSSFNYAGNQP